MTLGIGYEAVGVSYHTICCDHLAAMEATSSDPGKHDSSDPLEQMSARPNFLVLGYPWLNAMQRNTDQLITCCSVRKISAADCKQERQQKYTPALHAGPETPTTFIYATTDYALVPVEALDLWPLVLETWLRGTVCRRL